MLEEEKYVELFPEEEPGKGLPMEEEDVAAEPAPVAAEPEAEEPEPEENPKPSRGRRVWKELASWLLILVISFSVAIFINEVILINARIVSGSMEDTIMTGDRVMGLRFAYWFSEPQRQDIVIFYSADKSQKTLIKRIIGMPGDTVEIYDGTVYINGEPLEEPYLKEEMRGTFGPYEVPEGCYFMMGDNRNGSGDSRFWADPYLKREAILGKAVFIYWPHFQSLKLPD